MPLLQVRDFPADLYDGIKSIAKEENRTITQQTIVLIKKGLGEEYSNKKRKLRLLEEIKKHELPENIKKNDAVKWIREDRAR